MTWARIEENAVVELTDMDPSERFHPSLVWVSCPPMVETGWNYIDHQFQEPATEVSALPIFCSPAQGLVALFALKQITEEHVLEAIAQIPNPVQQYTARIGYQRATVWERGGPTMQSMAQLLQLSEENLDTLFAHAVTVQV